MDTYQVYFAAPLFSLNERTTNRRLAKAIEAACPAIRVNSLHGQAILEPGKRVVVEGIAEDGTIEAIRIADASAFASIS